MNRSADASVSLVSLRDQMTPDTRCPPKRTRTRQPGCAAADCFSSIR